MSTEIKNQSMWLRCWYWVGKNFDATLTRTFAAVFILLFLIPKWYAQDMIIPPVADRYITTGVAKFRNHSEVLRVDGIPFSCRIADRYQCVWGKKDRNMLKGKIVTVQWFKFRDSPFSGSNKVISIRLEETDFLSEKTTSERIERIKEDWPSSFIAYLIWFALIWFAAEWLRVKNIELKKLKAG
jgi:hypothetical protein